MAKKVLYKHINSAVLQAAEENNSRKKPRKAPFDYAALRSGQAGSIRLRGGERSWIIFIKKD